MRALHAMNPNRRFGMPEITRLEPESGIDLHGQRLLKHPREFPSFSRLIRVGRLLGKDERRESNKI